MKKFLVIASLLCASLAGCNNAGKSAGAEAADSIRTTTEGRIAYINLDSMMNKYDMYHDLRGEYEKKLTKVQNDLTARGRRLERDVADFQEKIQKGLVTRATAAQMEEDLTRRQQSFMEARERSLGELAEEEQVLLNQIHYSIVDFLEEFNADYYYDMIISTTGGGPILHANPALDVTSQVVAALNKQYAANKAAAAKK